MSKTSKSSQKKERAKAKAAHKAANYTRCGPKAGGRSKKKSAAGQTVGAGKTESPKPAAPVKTSAKGRKRRRRNGLQWGIKRG